MKIGRKPKSIQANQSDAGDWKSFLFQPVDASMLAWIRMVFGGLMAWEMVRYVLKGRIQELWDPERFHFTYYGFSWVKPFPGMGMHIECWLLAVAAIGIAIGWRYRICSLIFALGITHLFLIEQAKFMNHFYLICLLAWMFVVIPAHCCWSFDAQRRKEVRSNQLPAWTLWLLRFQMGVVYFYGGLAKLNSDWLAGEPMRIWLKKRENDSWFGNFFGSDIAPWFFSYGGLFFDLLIVPALLWKRSRRAAFVVALFFHLSNHYLFKIGVFPWLAIGLTTLYFEPEAPRKLWNRIILRSEDSRNASTNSFRINKGVSILLGLYALVQLLVPFRHWLYPGDASWTEEGHRFAWRMMLRSKTITAASIVVADPGSENRWILDPAAHLTGFQYREMLTRPDLIQQFATHISKLMDLEGHPGVEVRVVLQCMLNGHEPALLINPAVDLASQPRSLLPATWILARNEQGRFGKGQSCSALEAVTEPIEAD